jgi:hypothetical protein
MRLIIDILEPSPTLLKGAPISVFSVFGCFRKTYLFQKNLNWCASQIIKTLHPSHSFGSSGYWQCPVSSMYSNRSSVWPQKKKRQISKKRAFYHQFRTHGIWNSNPLKTHQARATHPWTLRVKAAFLFSVPCCGESSHWLNMTSAASASSAAVSAPKKKGLEGEVTWTNT